MEHIEVLLSAERGQYLPHAFADIANTTITVSDRAVLAAGPDHPHYWEVWDCVVDTVQVVDPATGRRYNLEMTENGDLLAVGVTVTITPDQDPMDPREDCGNLAVMYCEHGKYQLGDADADGPRGMDPDSILVTLPLSLYDHGRLTMHHGAPTDPWDSGLVGVHYVTREAAAAEWPDASEYQQKAFALATMRSELAVYHAYLRGDVWGFTVETLEGDTVDSCFGFYGDSAIEEMRDHVDGSFHAMLEEAWDSL